MNVEIFNKICFWKGLIKLFLISCLLCVDSINPEYKKKSEEFLMMINI